MTPYITIILALVLFSGCATTSLFTYNKRDVVVTKVRAGETVTIKLGGYNYR